MLSIEAINLSKEFKVVQSRPGLQGAFRDLFNRRYRTISAVQSLNLTIDGGEMVGYIGENGAGKSTTIKMMAGILEPTSGTIRVNGYNPHREREKFVKTIGVVFGQRSQLWWDIAVQESFRLLQKVYQIPKEDFDQQLDQMIEILNIESLLDQPVRKLSLGQRMRCELIASLLHRPSLLFLDEPTIGLDVLVKDHIRQFLKEINQKYGTTLLLTTHDLSDIEALCSRVIMLDQGKIIYDGSIDHLKNTWGEGKKVHLEMEQEIEIAGLQEKTKDLSITWEKKSHKQYSLFIHNRNVSVSEVLTRLIPNIPIKEMQIEEVTTEEIVRKIYQEGIYIV